MMTWKTPSFVLPTDDADNTAGGDRTTKPTRCIMRYFHMRPVHVSPAREPQLLDFFALISVLNDAIDQFTCRGSGYVLARVTKLSVVESPINML